MAGKNVSIWYDTKGDFLEIVWEVKSGDFIHTKDDRVMAKVDDEGNVIGFHVIGVSEMTEPVDLILESRGGTTEVTS
jgi:uncharacterized protein YuzE